MRQGRLYKKQPRSTHLRHISTGQSKNVLKFAHKVSDGNPEGFAYFLNGLLEAGIEKKRMKDIVKIIPRELPSLTAQKVLGSIDPRIQI